MFILHLSASSLSARTVLSCSTCPFRASASYSPPAKHTHTHTHTADKQSNTPTHGRRGVTNLLVWSGGLREVLFLEGARYPRVGEE